MNATRFALMPDVFTLSTVLPTEIKLAYKLSSKLPGWVIYSDGKENWKVLTLLKNYIALFCNCFDLVRECEFLI